MANVQNFDPALSHSEQDAVRPNDDLLQLKLEKVRLRSQWKSAANISQFVDLVLNVVDESLGIERRMLTNVGA